MRETYNLTIVFSFIYKSQPKHKIKWNLAIGKLRKVLQALKFSIPKLKENTISV